MGAQRTQMTLARVCAAAGLTVLLGACQAHYGERTPGQYAQGRNVHDSTRADQFLDRRDTITTSAGNAQAANRVIQMQDPWPAGSWNRNIPHDGTRMRNTVDAYREPPPPAESTQDQNRDLTTGPTTNNI